jgi:hypothetical protein
MPKLKQRDVTRLTKKWKCELPKAYVDFMKKHDPDEDVLEPDCFMLKIDGREAVVEGIMIAPLPTEGEDDIPGVEQPVETEIDEEWGGLHGSKRPKWLPEGAIPIGGTMWNARTPARPVNRRDATYDDDALLPRKRALLAQFLAIDPEGAGGPARDYWTA